MPDDDSTKNAQKAKFCCLSKNELISKIRCVSKIVLCQQKSSQSEAQIMTIQMSTSFYFLTSNQKLYNHYITHSMTLSMTHFRDAAWVTISVTLRRCRFS